MTACMIDPGMVWEICKIIGGPVIIVGFFILAAIGGIAGTGRDPSESCGH